MAKTRVGILSLWLLLLVVIVLLIRNRRPIWRYSRCQGTKGVSLLVAMLLSVVHNNLVVRAEGASCSRNWGS